MNDDILETLVLCNGCSHTLGVHDAMRCRAARCSCARTRSDVVEDNVTQTRLEHLAQFPRAADA